MTNRRHALLPLLCVVLCLTALIPSRQLHAQETSLPTDCADVSYMMAQDITPTDLTVGGGALQPNLNDQVEAGALGDQWIFSAGAGSTLGVTFSNAPADPPLEAALFLGMVRVADGSGVTGYAPITAGASRSWLLPDDGVYTLVVRRAQVMTADVSASYSLSANFTSAGEISARELRDGTVPLTTPPQQIGGHQRLTFSGGTNVLFNFNSAFSINSRQGLASQMIFDGQAAASMTVGSWANTVSYLGGDFSARGTVGEQERILYVESFGYEQRVDIQDLELNAFQDSDGAQILTDWQTVRGIWLRDACVGLKLQDERTFVAPLTAPAREVAFNGTLDDFAMQVLTPVGETAEPLAHNITLSWDGITPGSQMTLLDGVLTASLIGDRELRIESTDLDIRRNAAASATTPAQGDAAEATPQAEATAEPVTAIAPENVPLDITLNDQTVSITLDWVNMAQFELVDGIITLTFLDAPRSTTTRSGVNLSSFVALNDVIRMVYKPTEDDLPGEERLLLPAADSYLEIVTPAGFPAFDSLALPNEPNYAPRALNNLGGECYPVNTLLPEANCPPNGHVNPANGNVWYAVTDHAAPGGLLDLALTRSHNSTAVAVDGPFGFGWTTAFLLDYNVTFDPITNTRLVDFGNPEFASQYRVGLDVTWAARGIVTFTTPTGSRHVFASEEDRFEGGALRALTMPGWALSRANALANWTLRQDTGLTFNFDRAGRLVRYGYPEHARMVEIAYPRDTLEGAAGIGTDTPVIITDAETRRQLELYYDADHRIVRSVLRDLTGSAGAAINFAQCDPTRNCFETVYSYENGLLTGVTYADGQTATYRYDSANRLTAHSDPRAPVAPDMTYTYNETGTLTQIGINHGGETLPWRTLELPVVSATERTARVTDEMGNSRAYVYALSAETTLREVGAGYTLVQQTTPFAPDPNANPTTFDEVPFTYEWTNGLLTSYANRSLVQSAGRSSTNFEYTPTGQIAAVRVGYPTVTIGYDEAAHPVLVTFDDETTVALTYDAAGLPTQYTDRHGAVYLPTWNADRSLASVTRENDGSTQTYTYNEFGLVTSVTASVGGGDGHTIGYVWDGLGRLVSIDDPLIGAYEITYALPETGADGSTTSRTIIRGPSGATTINQFDNRGRLIETRLIAPQDERAYLRRTTYSYDVHGRITGQARWLLDEDGETNYTTAYAYEPVADLPPVDPGAGVITPVNGYRMTITDPAGRSETVVYDAFDRIRRVENRFGDITTYDYQVRDVTGFGQFPLRVVETAYFGEQITTTEYIFETRRQLRQVTRGDRSWTFNLDDLSTRLRSLNALPGQIQGEVNWEDYVAGLTPGVSFQQLDIQPNPQTSVALPGQSITATYDFLGRPTLLTDAAGNITEIAYCPGANGLHREIRANAHPAGDGAALTCDSTIFAQAHTTDIHGRIVAVEDAYGSRTFDYALDAATNEWVVTATFSDATADVYTWTLRYNLAGDLTQWTDEAGVTRNYSYDTLGQLRRVVVADEPEASFTFLYYNDSGLLREQRDDVGRGTRYQYNDQGQLTVEQNIRTADSTSYAYTDTGLLATVVSPLGGTTNFLYEDPDNPARLTGIIEPSGEQVNFTWDDANNRLTYTTADGRTVNYSFDTIGALWRVDEPRNRANELRYDGAGNLTNWLQAVTGEGTAQDLSLTQALSADRSGVEISAAGVEGYSPELTFNAAGKLTRMLPGTESGLALGYDALGRLDTASAGERVWSLVYPNLPAGGDFPVVTLTDPSELESIYSYDSLYRLRDLTAPGETVSYDYTADPNTNSVTLTVTGADAIDYVFAPGNGRDEQTRVELNAPGQRVTYVYDAEGLLTEIRSATCLNTENLDLCLNDSAALWTTGTTFSYDIQGRLTRAVDAEQNIETFAYDANSNLISYQNRNSKTFNYQYDELDRLTSIAGPTGIRLLLAYDELDSVVGICRATTPIDYPACVGAGGLLENYTHDTWGRLTTQNISAGGSGDDAQFDTVQHAYDPAGGGLLTRWGDVALTYSGDGLFNLQTISAQPSQYEFSYDGLGQVVSIGGAGATTYSVDPFGRIATLTAAGQTFTYAYADADRLFSVTAGGGSAIGYRLGASGLLASLDYALGGVSSTDPLLSFDYALNQGLLAANIARADDGTISFLSLDRLGGVQVLGRLSSESLFAEYLTDPLNRLRRARLSGDGSYFEIADMGYVIVTGYDDDDRPLTMRVNDDTTGELLYSLAFSYDAQGRLVRENRLYADDTQIQISYQYAGRNQDQVVRRRVATRFGDFDGRSTDPAADDLPPEVTPEATPETAAGLTIVLLTFGGTWLFGRKRLSRRQHWALLLLLGASFALVLPLVIAPAQAQSGSLTFTYDYNYDGRGNLTSVANENTGDVCATYTYDAANRLVEINADGGRRAFSYDADNRLVAAGDWQLVYQGDTTLPLAAVSGGAVTFFGQPAGIGAFFTASGDPVNTVLQGGHDELYVRFDPDGTDTRPLLLTDPLGRVLSLVAPQAPVGEERPDPCRIVALPDALGGSPPPQSGFGGMIWDVTTGLYFVDGRAYNPELGRFLQRAALDVFGNSYQFPYQQATPPVTRRESLARLGLSQLGEAQTLATVTDALTVAAVRAQHLPTPHGYAPEPLYEQLTASSDRTRHDLSRLVNLPEYLRTRYNLPGAQVDPQTGRFTLPTETAPGQYNLPDSAVWSPSGALWSGGHWLPTAPIMPLQRVEALVSHAQTPTYDVVHYLPLTWLPHTLTLSDSFITPPAFSSDETPGAVFAWLPQILTDPAANVDALELIAELQTLPGRSGADWLHAQLSAALPGEPDLPPADADELLATLFSGDTLGIGEALAQRWQTPAQPPAPVYEIGANVARLRDSAR